MKRIRLLPLLLTVVFAFSLLPCATAHYEEFDHPDTPFPEMVYTGIDTDAVDAFCARFIADPLGEYDALVALYNELYTQYALANIYMCSDILSEEASEENERTALAFDYADNAIHTALSEALAGEQGAALAARMPDGQAEQFADYQSVDDEQLDAQNEDTSLSMAYDSLPTDDTFEDAAAELYLRLVALRREEAARAGYDNYVDYAYLEYYAREYDTMDTKRLHEIVRKRYAPLYIRCLQELESRDCPWDDDDVPSVDKLLADLRAHIGDVSEELVEAMDYMLRNGLYCIGGEPLADAGFTDMLASYHAPFLFNEIHDRYRAYTDTVHEFGHFNASYHDPTPMLFQMNNVDLAEIQSQGLEMLMIPCLQDVLAGSDEDARSYVALTALSFMLRGVVEGCLIDEFEQTVYRDPDITAEGLFALNQSLYHAYGFDQLDDYDLLWCDVRHIFQRPLYYISYVVSALPALDIWLLSQEDPAAAAEKYLNVSAARTDAWLFDVLYDNDLCDITDPAALERLGQGLEKQIDALAPQRNPSARYVVAAASCAVVLLLAGVLIVRRWRPKEEI